jgi:hypothetical protein
MKGYGSGFRTLSLVLTCVAVTGAARSARAEFATIAGWDRQLFPSYIVATATVHGQDEKARAANPSVLGNGSGVLGVRLRSPKDSAGVRVTISSDLILEPSVFSGTLATEGEEYRINPNLKFKYATLIQNKQALPVDVTFRVEIDEQPVEEKTETIILRSINDCPRMIVDGKSVTDVRFMFAAYVNEQHPFVEKVLREALNEGIVDSFSGYQSGETAEVYGQVYALWKALSKRDVRYSNITATAASSEKVHSQHVRLIDESINNAQANCVDGSVLFASLLRKVGIEPYLVLIPGHCYVAFQVDKQGKEIAALETTLIGASLEGDAKEVDELSDVVDEDEVTEASWATFSAAFIVGRDNFQKHVEKLKDKKESGYIIISVAEARRKGILPIAFRSDAKFTPVPAAEDSSDEEEDEDDDEDDSESNR